MPTTSKRRLVLWVKNGEPPSERAKVAANAYSKLLPSDVCLHVQSVDEERAPVNRVPCLLFYVGSLMVCRLDKDLDKDAVLNALRRLG